MAWAPPDEAGPFVVSATTVRVPGGEGELVLEVWYPADPPAGAAPEPYRDGILTVVGGALRDAPALPPPEDGWPLVVFSHGFGGIRFQSTFLTEHLASHGFVVVAPDHAGSTMLDLDGDRAAEVAVRRPRDVRQAVDAVAAGVWDDLVVSTERYAVSGHSFGAWTALLVGGGRLDAAGFTEVCATTAPAACRFFEGQTFDVVAADRDAQPDPRAVATVALAPGGWYAFSPDGAGLSEVVAPLVLAGTLDDELPYASESLGTYDALGAPKALGSLEGAGHWQFSDLCQILPLSDCAGEAGGFLDPARTQALVRSRTLAHVRHVLRDEDRDLPWLAGTEDLTWTSVSAAR